MARNEAVQFTLDKNGLTIKASLRFCHRCLQPHPYYGIAYADLIEAGIRRIWTTTLTIDNRLGASLQSYAACFFPDLAVPSIGASLDVKTILYRDPRHGMDYGPIQRPPCRSLPIKLSRTKLLPSRVGSPFWRRGWGIFRVFQLESIGLNWTKKARGWMTMAPYRYVWQIEPVAAHEFGHLLGLGDAYGAIYRYYHAAEGTDNYLMRNNGPLTSEEMAMVLDAERLNKMQFFPKLFKAKQFKEGFKREVERIKKEADRF